MSIRIDKSLFTQDELRQYQALIAKASIDPEGGQEEMEDDYPTFPQRGTEKSGCKTEKAGCRTEKAGDEDGMRNALDVAMKRLSALEKAMEMKQFEDMAKKYAPLGENPEDLAKSLYSMSENPDNYYDYIGILDKSLELVEKSGLFTEIGKSVYGESGGDVVDKIESAASEIQKSDATMSRATAIAKAWENHPELVAEYDAKYRAK